MTEHENDPKAEEHVEDLDVPESESDDVKGGQLSSLKLSNKITGAAQFSKIDTSIKLNPSSGQFGDGSV